MKKILFLTLAFITAFTLSGCTETNNDDLNDPNNETGEVVDLGSEESLATLSYLSSGFLDFSNQDVNLSNNTAFLSYVDEEEPTVIEGELDEVNIYIDRLKVLIDGGVDDFGSVVEEESDNELYEFKLTFTVNEEVYVIYYNIDTETQEMTGIIVIGESEYEFEVVDNIKQYEHNDDDKPANENAGNNAGNGNNGNGEDEDDLDDEDPEDLENPDEDEDEEEEESSEESDDENETKMVLIATNGVDTIKITYKTEVEEGEFSTKFYVEKDIDGVESKVTLKISEEEDETVVKISDGEDDYSFKREVEEEGIVYKLQYEVDGVKGMVKITEITDEEGNVTYDYFILEAGREKHQEKQEPKSEGFDIEEDDEEEEPEDNDI